jgi:hypothetical protein
MGEMRNANKLWVEKPGSKISRGRLGRKWEDNIKTDRKEIGWGYELNSCGSG